MNSNILDMLITSYKIVHNDSFDIICDTNRRIKFIGTKLLDLFKLNQQSVVGYKLDEIVSPVQKIAEKYQALNDEIFEGKALSREYLSVINFDNGITIIHNVAKPIFMEKMIIGLHIHTKVVEPFSAVGSSIAFNLMKRNDPSHIVDGVKVVQLIPNKEKNYHLSDIQELIIYLVVLGKSDKDIVSLINEINNTDYTQQYVSKILTRNLFSKFEVTNRRELVEVVLKLNVIKRMPSLLLNNYNTLNINKL